VIAVTGASGYIGRQIVERLRGEGIKAVAFVRRPNADQRRFVLDQPVDDDLLDGIDTVIHAAYDLSVRGREVFDVNVRGSLPLLDALAARGGRVVLISSLAAYEGAPSLYGQAKLELERAVVARGGIVLRPGLVFGAARMGMFGQLVGALSGRSIVPMIGGGWQRLFVTHDERLCALVAEIVSGKLEPERPVFAAHEVPTTLRAVAAQIVRAFGRRPKLIPVPASLAYACLRRAEAGGLSLPVRSDSLNSLLHPIPLDQVASLARAPIAFPPLIPGLWHFTPLPRSSPVDGRTASARVPDRR
jgi:nucleoside-diphosphate-sugar epimerase